MASRWEGSDDEAVFCLGDGTVTHNSAPPLLPDHARWSEDFHSFLAACLVKDFKRRPSAAMLLTHPFIVRAASSAVLMEMIKKAIISNESKEDKDLSKDSALAVGGGMGRKAVKHGHHPQASACTSWRRSASAAESFSCYGSDGSSLAKLCRCWPGRSLAAFRTLQTHKSTSVIRMDFTRLSLMGTVEVMVIRLVVCQMMTVVTTSAATAMMITFLIPAASTFIIHKAVMESTISKFISCRRQARLSSVKCHSNNRWHFKRAIAISTALLVQHMPVNS